MSDAIPDKMTYEESLVNGFWGRLRITVDGDDVSLACVEYDIPGGTVKLLDVGKSVDLGVRWCRYRAGVVAVTLREPA
jgi:hypothetical protein